MLYSELRSGMRIVWEGELWEVVEADFLRMQKRKPVMRTKLKHIISGKVQERSFQPSDTISEADLERMNTCFIYENKGEYWFNEKENPSNRFSFSAQQLGSRTDYLKSNLECVALMHEGKVVDIMLPIKVDLEVIEAPPSIKGDTSSGGSKTVVVETGVKISTPLFISQGDVIRINTQTGEYSERAEKA